MFTGRESIAISLGIVWLRYALVAGEIAVGSLASPYLDTEASTNVVFNILRNDVTAFDVRIELAASVSNCVQVAFGRDADGDGELDAEETGLVLGWRSGRCFVEDVAGEVRRFEEDSSVAGTSRYLHLRVETDSSFVPRSVVFDNDLGTCFPDIAAECPTWLFSKDWNLLKVTRRGVSPSDELCRIRNDYRHFRILFR